MTEEFKPSADISDQDRIARAVSDAVDHGTVTWITAVGAPVAAIVPRGLAETGLLAWNSQSWRHPHSVIVIDGNEENPS